VSDRVHVAIGGGLGALVRGALVLAALSVADLGEVVVVLALNVLGAFALGWLAGRVRHDARMRRLVPLVGTGFLGALTTFSALAVHVGGAVLAGAWVLALGLGALHLVVGTAVALLGFRLGDRRVGDGAVVT
jgi:fluoride exporter